MRLLSLLISLLVFGTACSTEPHTDLFSITGAVEGSVLTGADVPVAGATVTATAQYPLPAGTGAIVATALTDTEGHFRVLLVSGNLPDTIAPLALRVTASGYAERDTAGLQIRIARSLSPLDTAHIVITLAP
ncbi:MAG TPA: carboxypeptidase-like regulatory domain-containing protein [Gemmatimonadaceae bacterium]|nr:carboxypeptidase-like regulatory domain-containing protein [Gemmatimonadaceae bacterium]